MKIKQISIIVLSLIASTAMADSKRGTPIEFKQEFNLILEAGIQSGGDGSHVVPIYQSITNTYIEGSSDIYIPGEPWVGIDESVNEPFRDGIHFGAQYKVAIGLEFPLFENIMLSLSYGYQFDETFGVLTEKNDEGERERIKDSDARFKISRNTLDIMPFYNYGRHRFGLGVSYHLSPEFLQYEYRPPVEKSEGVPARDATKFDSTHEFDNALGYSIQYDYLVTENTSIGIRATKIEYDYESVTTHSYVGTLSASVTEACAANCKDRANADSVGVHITYHY